MNVERNSLSPDKGKRRLKTPAQVQALEKFYNGTIAASAISEILKILFGFSHSI